MAFEIAIGQVAKCLQLRKVDPFGVRHERCHDSKSRSFMKGAIETIVGELATGTPSMLASIGFMLFLEFSLSSLFAIHSPRRKEHPSGKQLTDSKCKSHRPW